MTLVIEIEDGVERRVLSDGEYDDVLIADFDTDGVPPEDLCQLTVNGITFEARVTEIELSPKLVRAYRKAYAQHGGVT